MLMLCASGVRVSCADPASGDITSELKRIEAQKDDSQKKLGKLQKKTRGTNKALARINKELANLAKRSNNLETVALEAETRLEKFNGQQARLQTQFQENSTALEDFLAALILWQGRRPPLLLSAVHETHDSIRAAILMGETAPVLERQAHELAKALEKLSAVRTGIEGARKRLHEADIALKTRREQVAALARNKRDLLARLNIATRQIRHKNRTLAGDAKNLRDLVEKLIASAPSAPIKRPDPPVFKAPARSAAKSVARPLQPKSASSAGLSAALSSSARPAPPTPGKILYSFGQPDNSGEKQEGLTYTTRRNAQITAPLKGRVAFAESLRTYGHIVILDVGNGYMLVLAGMDNVLVSEGQTVFAGEPLGYMSPWGDVLPRLYFEVRRHGKPVDPDRWMKRKI